MKILEGYPNGLSRFEFSIYTCNFVQMNVNSLKFPVNQMGIKGRFLRSVRSEFSGF
ncbi:hypothetical protein RchiOBHm_Chr5g0074631 [Rosa chinensis]|uniref:Uncharacterized protein n=1 Tax=Rosa chinensis TaxID=74649 RepID=A0A2P6QL87_ROSCH|nr:hypothetical protein RchiOBHm_Chr5g0074631 [Rosa chinensis]